VSSNAWIFVIGNYITIVVITHEESYGHTTHNRFMALWILSGTTQVSRYQKKHSPTHAYRGHQSSRISLPSITIHGIFPVQFICLNVFSLHTPYISSPTFHNTCPYHCTLYCCSTEIMSSNPSLSSLHLELYVVA